MEQPSAETKMMLVIDCLETALMNLDIGHGDLPLCQKVIEMKRGG